MSLLLPHRKVMKSKIDMYVKFIIVNAALKAFLKDNNTLALSWMVSVEIVRSLIISDTTAKWY